MKRTYTCDMCGKTFHSDRAHEDAIAEFERDFGEFDPEAAAVVCDDCYRKINKRWEESL